MKIRGGFVSNSSSSSFIITGEDNIKKAKEIIEQISEDYYELDGVLYTSFISDNEGQYNSIYELADADISGGHDSPYDEEDFFEFDGDLGVTSVYIEKYRCKDKFKAEQDLKDKLYDFVKNYIYNNEITSTDVIHKNKEVLADAPYFLEQCCDIIGYVEE